MKLERHCKKAQVLQQLHGIVDVWLNVTLGDKLCANINATHSS
jgi:hypothetical protein